MSYEPHEHHRSTDPSTSVAAAHSMSGIAASICARILDCLRFIGPSTQTEIAAHLSDIDRQAVNKRISDLKNQGLAEPSGLTRPGPSGRQQIVWKATSA